MPDCVTAEVCESSYEMSDSELTSHSVARAAQLFQLNCCCPSRSTNPVLAKGESDCVKLSQVVRAVWRTVDTLRPALRRQPSGLCGQQAAASVVAASQHLLPLQPAPKSQTGTEAGSGPRPHHTSCALQRQSGTSGAGRAVLGDATVGQDGQDASLRPLTVAAVSHAQRDSAMDKKQRFPTTALRLARAQQLSLSIPSALQQLHSTSSLSHQSTQPPLAHCSATAAL